MKAAVAMNPKSKWYGPKQVGLMLYTAVLFLIGTSIIGGNNNTVYPMFAEIRGWDLSLINVVSGIACILKAFGILALAKLTRKLGAKLLTSVTLFISAALVLVLGFTESISVFLVTILVIGFLGGGYEKNGGMTLTANWWPTKKGIVLGITTMGIVAMNFLYVPQMPKLLGALGLGGGMAVIAGIVVVVGIICLIFVKNNPEEAGEYPDGDPEQGLKAEELAQLVNNYKSQFTVGKLLKDKDTWFIGLGSGFAFMAVMSYIASAIPAMMSYGYGYPMASSVFAVGGFGALVGSFVFGLIDQKFGTKKTFVAYFVFIIIGFILNMMMPKGEIFCWLAGIVIFTAQGALCNLLPSYVATKFGRWDYNAGYQVIGTMFEIFAGIGIMMTGFFTSFSTMYIVDIVFLVIGLIFMALSNDKFIGKHNT